MTTTVPAILKFLQSQDFSVDQNIETPQRAKKRRLDHLSWEEKVQRKKLKNRVAAQTSRDRKKAKVEHMEQALQQLFSQNEALKSECETLKATNERLSQENKELYDRLQMPCANCSQNRTVECETQNGSAARKGHTLSSGFEQTSSGGTVEDNTDLPSLPDLLDELDTEVDINSLEQLTQSLLQDIARDLEAAAQKTDCEEPVCNRQFTPKEMVGSSSAKLESSGSDMLKDDRKSLENDISEYLLLHHNYAAKPPKCTKRTRAPSTRCKLKVIKPKIDDKVNANKLAIDINTPIILADDIVNGDIICGNSNDGMNCVTIFVDDNGIPISETITEVITDSTPEKQSIIDSSLLTIPSQAHGGLSPMSSSSSDNGYESLDSPNSLLEMDWDQSVSELFPSLM